jgi:hypothetical protein
VALLGASCGEASRDPGSAAWLRVAGAQFVPGALSASSGPPVVAVNLSRSTAQQGESGLHLSGALAPEANAVAIALEGDRGFWLLPAAVPDVATPGAPSFGVTLAVSRDAPAGLRTLQVVARAADGIAGALSTAALEITAPPEPTGELVVSLRWDTNADLDVHVVDGNGVEIWARNPNSWRAVPGAPPDPNAWRTGGLLDVDSNAQCVIDGRNRENVVWTVPPPPGHYLVRVDAFSMCGQAGVQWRVDAVLRGERIAAAEGSCTPASTRPPHELGAGVLAVEFDVP